MEYQAIKFIDKVKRNIDINTREKALSFFAEKLRLQDEMYFISLSDGFYEIYRSEGQATLG